MKVGNMAETCRSLIAIGRRPRRSAVIRLARAFECNVAVEVSRSNLAVAPRDHIPRRVAPPGSSDPGAESLRAWAGAEALRSGTAVPGANAERRALGVRKARSGLVVVLVDPPTTPLTGLAAEFTAGQLGDLGCQGPTGSNERSA